MGDFPSKFPKWKYNQMNIILAAEEALGKLSKSLRILVKGIVLLLGGLMILSCWRALAFSRMNFIRFASFSFFIQLIGDTKLATLRCEWKHSGIISSPSISLWRSKSFSISVTWINNIYIYWFLLNHALIKIGWILKLPSPLSGFEGLEFVSWWQRLFHPPCTKNRLYAVSSESVFQTEEDRSQILQHSAVPAITHTF